MNRKIKNWHKIKKEDFIKSDILTKEKCEIMFHNASNKILIGGKGSGKSNIATCDALYRFENKPHFSAMGIRLLKGQASEKLSKLFTTSIDTFNIKGFKTYDYTQVYNKVYQKINKASNDGNNIFEWGSLDASGATDGTSGVKGGIVGLLLMDEPLIRGVKEPSENEWKEDCAVRKDNLERTIERWNELHKNDEGFEPEKFFTYYCLNPWGEHPILDEAEEILPEIEFEKFCLGGFTLENLLKSNDLVNNNWDKIQESLLNNTTMSRYFKQTDTLVSRMTKFANPLNKTSKKIEEIMYSIKWNLLKGKRNAFCILLGLKNEQVANKTMLVYDIVDYNVRPLEELLETKWKPIQFTYSLDIDTSREFNISCGLFLRKIVSTMDFDEPYKYIYHLYMLPPIILQAFGTGDAGELNDVYVKQIKDNIQKHYNEYIAKFNISYGDLWVDDNRQYYNNELRKGNIFCINKYKMFQKTGKWDIKTRQDITQTLFKSGVISLHKKNKGLIQDMKNCIKDDINSPKRKTTSTTNHLDAIDSMEQVFWNYVGKLTRKSNQYSNKELKWK